MKDDDFNINKVVAELAKQKLEDISKPTLDKIQEVWLKAKTRSGFTPSPEEAEKLKRISNNTTYKSFKSCVGNAPYLRFIKVGLLLYELMTQGNLDRIREIKDEIYNSKYNQTALKIIHIASTGVLLNTLEYLINLKDERELSKHAISLEFERILELWQKISIPVKKEDLPESIIKKIKEKIDKKEPLIILYASQTAVQIAHEIIAQIRNCSLCDGKYHPWSKNLYYENIEQYICIFYKLGDNWDTPFG